MIAFLKKRKIVGHLILTVPPSKSMAQRLLILAALSDAQNGISLVCPQTNDDIAATIRCLTALGAHIVPVDDGYTVFPIDFRQQTSMGIMLDAGESGATLRFLLPIVGVLGTSVVFVRRGSLAKRPLEPLISVLTEHGMQIYEDKQTPELLRVSGKLTAGFYEIDGSISSQFITGLLLALPLLNQTSRLRINRKPVSAPYLDMTLDALQMFSAVFENLQESADGICCQISPYRYHTPEMLWMEGDWSAAVTLLCGGVLCGCGVTVNGVSHESRQGDRKICTILTDMGCPVKISKNAVSVFPPENGVLSPCNFDGTDTPDMIPSLALLCAAADGESRISGCHRLVDKESDRLSGTVHLLRQIGVEADTDGDMLTVQGIGRKQKAVHLISAEIAPDHRMVMAASLAALLAPEGIGIPHAETVRKSYPDFFDAFSAFCDIQWKQ